MHVRVVCFAAASVLLASCGGVREERLPDTGATIEGTVKYGGEQLSFARVTFTNGKDEASGAIEEDGRYKIANAPLGLMKVSVDTAAAKGDFIAKSMQAGAYKGPESTKAAKVGVKFIDVPGKFADTATSGLTFEVKPGANTFDLVIPK